MRVIILAAGLGKRLRPYTDNNPKCMVKLAGKALLQHQLSILNDAGLKDIVIVGGYCAAKLNTEGLKLIVNPNFGTTNMVTTLFCAEAYMQEDQDLLISYSDIIYEPRVLQSLLETDAPIALSVDREWRTLWEARMEDPLTDAETLKLTDTNRITELGKKPQSYEDIQGQYMGIIKIRKDMIKRIIDAWHNLNKKQQTEGSDVANMYMTSFIQLLIDGGVEVKAAFTDGGWIEIDTASDLEIFNDLHLKDTLKNFIKLKTYA